MEVEDLEWMELIDNANWLRLDEPEQDVVIEEDCTFEPMRSR